MPRINIIGLLALNKIHSFCKYPGLAMFFKEHEGQFALHNFIMVAEDGGTGDILLQASFLEE